MPKVTPIYKRVTADRLLVWLVEHQKTTWPRTVEVLQEAAADLGEEVFNLWKAFDVLLIMGRVERNNPNGREGARLVDPRPLSEPAKQKAGGLIVIKLPEKTLAEISQDQINGFKRAFPEDMVVVVPLEGDLVIGQRAREDLVRFRDELNRVLEGKDNGG